MVEYCSIRACVRVTPPNTWPFFLSHFFETSKSIWNPVHDGDTTINRVEEGPRLGGKLQARRDRHESWLFSAGQDRDKLEVPNNTISLAGVATPFFGTSRPRRRPTSRHIRSAGEEITDSTLDRSSSYIRRCAPKRRLRQGMLLGRCNGRKVACLL